MVQPSACMISCTRGFVQDSPQHQRRRQQEEGQQGAQGNAHTSEPMSSLTSWERAASSSVRRVTSRASSCTR